MSEVEKIVASVTHEDGATDLVVFVHGFNARIGELAGLISTLHEARPEAAILAPEMPYSASRLGMWCREDAAKIVDWLVQAIDRLDNRKRQGGGAGYEKIVLVGHSFGAVIARKIAIVAHGETPDAAFEPGLDGYKTELPWAQRIERVVLLAGMTRGWSPSSAMNWWTSFQWGLGSTIVEAFMSWTTLPTIFSIRKGAPFLIQTRLQWLALMRQLNAQRETRQGFFSVQLLGTVDDFVAPDDNVDFAVDFADDGNGRSFFYINVHGSDHSSVVKMNQRLDTKVQTRRERLTEAVSQSAQQLEQSLFRVAREHMADSLPPAPDDKVTDVVFVIHGIRDKGFWTQKIAAAVKQAAIGNPIDETGKKRKFSSVTASYGYFAMGPFMFPWVRWQKAAWLMDRYTEAKACYPCAKFSYVGHSNGTYLLAHALHAYPAARFKNVVFAGSVVRCDYDWRRFMVGDSVGPEWKPRVQRVLNYVATADWVVAMLPKAMQPLRRFDLGSAGFDGFIQADPKADIHEVRYVKGSHSAGLVETQWDEIAKFVVTGEVPAGGNADYDNEQDPFWTRWSARATSVFAGGVAAVLAIGLLILYWMLFAEHSPVTCSADMKVVCAEAINDGWVRLKFLLPVVVFLIYLKLVKTIITKL
jgi:pimeloyl-ACP methyl ester carboxylesterase